MKTEKRALDPGSNEAEVERSLPWYPTRKELIAPLSVILLSLAFSWWFSAGSPATFVTLAGPFSGELAHGRTPSPIIAIALPGGALFWVLFAFWFLPRWEGDNKFFRSAALTGFAMAWMFVGFLELVLASLRY
ncbi:MAG: hypothetical protein ACYS26_15770 [Planctomycetota bacterium]|jgi:hypothetical protein